MKILVTGGAGFTGSTLVKRLLSRGHDVTVLDKQPCKTLDTLELLGAKVITGSLNEPFILEDALKDQQILYHLAAAARNIKLSKQDCWDTNVTAMRSLLDSAMRAGVAKVIYCSTQGVYGNMDNPPGDETTPIKPVDYYHYTRYEGEIVAREFIAMGMDVTIIRPAAIYGPGDPAGLLRLFRQVIKGRVPVFRNGETLCHPVYVENLADAFELAAEKQAAKGQTYLIADNEYFTIKDVILKIAKVLDVEDLKIINASLNPAYIAAAVIEKIFKPLPCTPANVRDRVEWLRLDRAFKIDKAKNELGYNPAINLDEGLKLTYQWYKDNCDL